MRFALLTVVVAIGFAAAATKAGPTTNPIVNPGAESISVLILPFGGLGDVSKTAWIPQAIQQNLLNELGRMRAFDLMTLTNPPAEAILSIDAARQAGAKAGASFVIFGSYQTVDGELRLVGFLIDLRTTRLVGGMRATGSMRDLFALEDQIAEQARRLLIQHAGIPADPPKFVAVIPPAIEKAAAGAPALRQPQGPVPAPAHPWERDDDVRAARDHIWGDDYDRSLYNYDYGYPYGWPYYYGYGYGYWGPRYYVPYGYYGRPRYYRYHSSRYPSNATAPYSMSNAPYSMSMAPYNMSMAPYSMSMSPPRVQNP